jgi:tripartite-type tricarboxylate transporter receptor subunit TctC
MTLRNRFVAGVAAAALALGGVLASTAPSLAQFPEKTITIIVPFNAGSGNDAYARMIAEELQKKWGQPVVVENVVGAGGLIGTAQVAMAPPDGYTLLTGSSSLPSAQVLRANPEFDVATDFAPIAQYHLSPVALVVNKDLPVNSVDELVAYAKENPINFGSNGIGSIIHLNSEIFNAATGIKAENVPYTGGGPAIQGAIGGEVQYLLIDYGAAQAMVEEGQLRVLGIGSPERNPLLPDVPTFKELGYDIDLSILYGMFAPAGTPPEVIQTLNEAINEIVGGETYRKFIEDRGGVIVTGTPEQFGEAVKAEVAKLANVVDTVGIPRE